MSDESTTGPPDIVIQSTTLIRLEKPWSDVEFAFACLIEDGHGAKLANVLAAYFKLLAENADTVAPSLEMLMTVLEIGMPLELHLAGEKRTLSMLWGRCPARSSVTDATAAPHDGIPCRECGARPEPS